MKNHKIYIKKIPSWTLFHIHPYMIELKLDKQEEIYRWQVREIYNKWRNMNLAISSENDR